MHGNERNYCVALVALDPDAIADWAKTPARAKRRLRRDREVPTPATSRSPATSTSSTRASTAGRPIKKWELLDHDLTVESGELTPSMKVKRNVVEDNYKDVISGFYA